MFYMVRATIKAQLLTQGATMPDDIVTMAENKLDTLLQSDDGDQQTPPPADDQGEEQQPPVGDESTDEQEDNGNQEEESQDGGQPDESSQEEESGQGEEDAGGEDEEQSDEGGKPKGDEAPKELSDEEFLAELEKRGLKVTDKDDESKKDADQDKPAPKFDRPEELPEQVWNTMPPVNQYIYRELPYISIKGKDGETIRVKTPEQIPEDFDYASKREERIADDAFLEQHKLADNMHTSIRTQAQTTQRQREEEAENQVIRDGVDELQAKGIVPKITAQPGSPEFNDDPGVQRANEILKYRHELMEKGEKISVYSAGLQYKALHPEKYEKKVSKGDQERKAKSKNISGGGRGTQQSASNKNKRPKFPANMSAADIADYYAQDLD